MTEDPNIRLAISALAMHALATSSTNGWVQPSDAGEIARRAVILADALLAEIAKPRMP